MYNLQSFLPYNYRTNLLNVNWSESVVMFGCSMVYGEALDVEDTIPYHLSTLLDIPVINMGAIGSSMYFAFYNQLVLCNNYPKPKGVINLWTEHSRSTLFKDPIEGYGPWNIHERTFGYSWAEYQTHANTHALMIQSASKALWKEIPYYEATFFKSTQSVLNCDQLVGHMSETDYAKDGEHPGPLATKECASYIASRFKLS